MKFILIIPLLLVLFTIESIAQHKDQVDSLQQEVIRLKRIDSLKREIMRLEDKNTSRSLPYDLNRERQKSVGGIVAGTLLAIPGFILLGANDAIKEEFLGAFAILNGTGLAVSGSIVLIHNIAKLARIKKKADSPQLEVKVNGAGIGFHYSLN